MLIENERQLQERVKHWLIDDLKYNFLGNLENKNNYPVIYETLRKNLLSRNYTVYAVNQAIELLDKLIKNQNNTLYKANEEIYNLIRYGAYIQDSTGNHITVNYIDWLHTERNNFDLAEEVTISFAQKKRPDLVLYVNGIALGMIELKNSCNAVAKGIRQIIRNQSKECIQEFFFPIQILMAGNGSEGLRYGVIETPEKYYLTWKEDLNANDSLSQKIRAEQSREKNILRSGLISLCQHDRFLSLIHDFIIFDRGVKKIARHNQFFAVKAAQTRIKQGEGGIIWNTQGSGKSLIMVWLAKWIRENIDNSRVVIITDREELDSQIEGVFIQAGEKNIKRAKSGEDLRNILNLNEDSIICSLIHKYGHNVSKGADIDLYIRELVNNLPKNYEAKGNIIAFIDECHRTNSGKLHQAVKKLMPHAVLIGFTGTPLLKTDKLTSLQIFGAYIHKYKFDEAVRDKIVVDLRYQARDVDQYLTNPQKIDTLFELKTQELSERAKNELKRRWAVISKLYSSRERLERIASDIIFDMEKLPRLANNSGNALLVAGSIYEACRYWEIFQSKGFTKCAVVTSYEPSEKNISTGTSEDEYKKKIYERMLGSKSAKEFEDSAKKIFTETPAKMKLLIVVDKLLTGFDAPHATYLYIDKSMRDHDLFQAICRVNRRDGDSKEHGYIIDYMDLFRNIESAIKDYTSGAFDKYDKNEIENFLKSYYDESKSEMLGSLKALKELFSGVGELPEKNDSDYIKYFCGEDKELERENLYKLTSSAARSFANCCDRLVSHYDYNNNQVNELRREIREYNRVKDFIKLASHDYIDLKGYDSDMRYILDTYIHAEESRVISELAEMSLVELLVDGKFTRDQVLSELNCDDSAKPEIIENNIIYEIVQRMNTNNAYYGNLSEILNALIKRRKSESLNYEKYLDELVKIARKVLHPEEELIYPDSIRTSAIRRAIYDYFSGDEKMTLTLYSAIKESERPDFRENPQKARKICRRIREILIESGRDSESAMEESIKIFELVKSQNEQ